MMQVPRARFVVLGTLLPLLALGGLVAFRAAGQRTSGQAAPWTLRSEHLAVIRLDDDGDGAYG
jgi:hypothetical protein